MPSLDFSDRVAVITGSGRGIGRAYAELLAARGAKVVINDIGGRMAGDERDETLAEATAAEITAQGGTAEHDSSDISTEEGAANLVAHAVEAFGGLDIVINNAGIFALDAFPDITSDALGRFLGVHVLGSFNVTRAAWPHLTRTGRGRVVLTTSTSALGAADTVSYGTAKMGVFGLGRALAHVGEPLGVKVNLVAPMAMTRMMSTGMGIGDVPPEAPALAPALVAPLVGLLCHDSCPVNGETFVSGMRRVSRLVVAESRGYTHQSLDLTIEDLQEHWDDVMSAEQENVSGTMAWSAINQRHIEATPVE